MAAGEPYFTCDNSGLPLDEVLRDMIVQDADGNPAWRVYETGGGGGGSGFSSYTETTLTIASNQVVKPSGTLNNLFYGGQRLYKDIGYTIVGNTITFTGTPPVEDGEPVLIGILN